MKKNKSILLAAMLAAGAAAGVAAHVENMADKITYQEPARNTKQRPVTQQTLPYITNQRRTFLGNSIPKNKPKRTSFLGPGLKKKHNNRTRTNRIRRRQRQRSKSA
jgi:hypothetical protein